MSGEHDVSRWRPIRVGICNIWEYDDHVIEFADGRMILRGPNGSGKSNALALLFPFLIDGTMSAAAMDPFAGGRSMKSLLLGVVRDDSANSSRFRHEQRLGYVWMEFELADAAASVDAEDPPEPRRVTIGCGARANANSDAKSWFFVTDRRVGHGLDLAPGGEPLTRPRLAEVIGADAVFETADEYRSAVDRALFGLGSARLGKLVSLIRVLRRPQLAGKLDLDLLSQVLSDGLPAIDPAVLDDVASSLDDLEATQRELSNLATTRAVIDEFLPIYVRYLRGEAALRASLVVEAGRTRVRSRRSVTAATTEQEQLAESLEANRVARGTAQTRRMSLDERRTAIIESPAFKDASSLREVEASADRARGHANKADERRRLAGEEATKVAELFDQRRSEAKEATSAADRALTAVIDAADAADAAWTLSRSEAADPSLLEVGLRVVVRARRDDVAAVQAVLTRVESASRDHRHAEDEASRALRAADDADGLATVAAEQLEEAQEQLTASVVAWARTAPGLDRSTIETLVEKIGALHLPGTSSIAECYRALVAPQRELLAAEIRSARDRIAGIDDETGLLQKERDAVAAETDSGPAAPPWRADGRAHRPGAPLWACCDFAEAMTDADRSGLEAALDAAGLLDAWIAPTGGNTGDDGETEELDSFLDPVAGLSESGAQSQPSLGALLVSSPPQASGLSIERVDAALASIALGTLGVAVNADGRFVLGPLHGRALKPTAEFIGATARAARRLRRLAELDAGLETLAQRRADETGLIDVFETKLGEFDVATLAIPPADGLLGRAGESAAARATAEADRRVAVAAAAAEASAAQELTRRQDELVSTAAARRLRATREAMTEVARLVDLLSDAGNTALRERVAAIQQQQRADDAGEADERARAELARCVDDWTEKDREATGLHERASTFRRQLGPDAEAPLVALRSAETELRQARLDEDELAEARSGLDAQLGEARQRVESAELAVVVAERRFEAEASRLSVLRRADLLAFIDQERGDHREVEDAAVVPPSAPDEFARWLAGAVGEGPPSPERRNDHQRALDRAQKVLIDELHHGYDAALAHEDDIVLVEVTSEVGVFPLARLASELATQQQQLESYLTEGDRIVFERYLLNQVSHGLRRLLSDADDFVAGVNDALSQARTASGIRVELAWDLGVDDDAIRAAVGLLRHDTEQMGDDDRAALRVFFDRVIREQRALDPAAGYRSALEAALDYRSWHVFRPVLLTATGTRTRLTRARFRELSGGEQAVALHLPLFAAAAAHYARAAPTAPRLIALDEAFAGIDEAMRGELMGLTVRFDLDLIMTGHELWGAYAEVPSIAIHDLLRRPPQEGVSILSLRWDGHGLVDAG